MVRIVIDELSDDNAKSVAAAAKGVRAKFEATANGARPLELQGPGTVRLKLPQILRAPGQSLFKRLPLLHFERKRRQNPKAPK